MKAARFFYGFELVVLGYLAIVGATLVIRAPGPGAPFLLFHLAGASLITLLAYAERRFGGPFWRIARHWLAIFYVMALFRELHYVIPLVHPFDHHAFDAALMKIDARLFGDVRVAVERLWWPPLVEFLHLCYWAYFPLPAILAIALWRANRLEEFRRFGAVYLAGLCLGYLLYMIVPAVGPQHFEPRSELLGGMGLGRILHGWLYALERVTADAFPSLHTFAAGMVLVYSWGRSRRLFRWLLVPATGLIAATVVLRYHYVIDLVAGLALVPIALAIGDKIHRAVEAES